MKNNNFCVYIHINKINNKSYIGITSTSLEKRSGKNGSGYKRSPIFWNAIQKYGWDSFDHIIFESDLSKDVACYIEQKLILLYNTNKRDFGYNMSFGGESGNYGCKASEETRKKQSVARRGHKNANYGNHKLEGKNNPFYGKHHTVETMEKMREKHRLSKKVICIETGEIFRSIREAKRLTNINKTSISGCCNGKQNTAGGYHWMFVF